MRAARLRQWRADLLASFWLRPALMTAAAVAAAELLVLSEGAVELPPGVAAWVYAGGTAGARDVLGAIAASAIGVAGTTFSITVAALTLASNQMGPRLLRNFTRDAGNQPGLNWSSQRQPEPLAAPRQRPRRAFSTQGSCEVWC